MSHGDDISLVLSRTWHIEIFRSLVKLHAESELCFLLAWSIYVVRVARIREIEVAWNVVLRAWHSHELNLVALLFLYISNFGRKFGAIVNCGSLSTFISHAESCCFGCVGNMNWVVSTWAQVGVGSSLVFSLRWWVTEGPLWRFLGVFRAVLTRRRYSIVLVRLGFGTSENRFCDTRLGQLRCVLTGARRILSYVSDSLVVSLLQRESITFVLMRFPKFAQISVDMIILSWSWSVEDLLALVRRFILLTTVAKSRVLAAIVRAILGLN